jgi:uncharacterized protein YqjF (DUF2071 family)
MHNRWTDLLFLHWKFDPAVIQALLPPGLLVDQFEGTAWVGVVPFGMERIRPVFCPPIPGLSWFLELNLRTYVVDARTGIPGVWFFSLDASQWIACTIARRCFHLPYFYAQMQRQRGQDGWIHYRSQHAEEPVNEFRYRPQTTSLQMAPPETLEFFLLERYVLFAWNAPRGQLSLGRVFHEPYQFCPAEVGHQEAGVLFARAQLAAPVADPVSILYAPMVQTLIYPLRSAQGN